MCALFDRAAALSVDARTAYLGGACPDDAGVRAEVEALLAFDRPGDQALDAGIRRAIGDAAVGLHLAAPHPSRIGPYRVISHIGDGGMGAVYLAEREGDFNPRVAVKVIRGLAGEDGLRRFRAERQILAALQHPGITRLLDGGATAGGLPYLVMEHVDGMPIDRYCESRGLTVAARVALLRRVCDAVSHAHRGLVVHRDLKPSNILVTADGSPKLLDFGIARLLDDERAEGGDARVQTAPSRRLLTPDYASPEQVRGDPITTSTDVYSLGVLLFELLTGTRPLTFASRGATEIARVVCGQTAPRPSAAAASNPRFARQIAGDLDTIVLAALEKDPARRYASVDHLSDDLRRFLERRPVLARPATWRYRARRLVRRHRAATAAAAMSVVIVAGFAIALAVAGRRAARERDAAERVTTMLVHLLSASPAPSSAPATITPRDLVDRGIDQVRRDLRDEPALQARLFEALGAIYAGLGLVDRAQAALQESVAAGQAAGAEDSQAGARTMWRLAEALRDRGRYAEAEPLARAAYAMSSRLVGTSNPQSAQMLNTLGMILHARGRQDEAAPMFLRATEIFATRSVPIIRSWRPDWRIRP